MRSSLPAEARDAESGKVSQAAGVVFAATMASRILGFVRDAVMAAVFGAGGVTDAFFIAFRFPNLLRKLFADGILSIAFIPVFTEHYVNQGQESAFHLATSVLKFLFIMLSVMIAIGIFWTPEFVRYCMPGMDVQSNRFELTIRLIRLMFPYCLFIGLAAVSMGLLNVTGHFVSPALAPIALNLAIIGCIYLLSPQLSTPIYGPAIGIVIGGALQWLIQLPALFKKNWRFNLKAPIYNPAMRRIGRLALPAIISAGAYQINVLIITLLATFLPGGSVSYIYYADRLIEFPLGLFGTAAATAILPSLSRFASAGEIDKLTETFEFSFNMLLFIMIPAMFGLIIMREPIILALFKRGEFSMEAVRQTANALIGFSIGLWAFAGVRIAVSLFYSFQETKIPMIGALAGILLNFLLALGLIGTWGHFGLALAPSIAAIFNLLLLLVAINQRLKGICWKKIGKCACKSIVCSLIMSMILWRLELSISATENYSFFSVVGMILIGVITYILAAKIVKCEELEFILLQIKTAINRGSCQNKTS